MTCHPDADPDAGPDSDFYLMRMRILLFTLMRIRIQILANKYRLRPVKKKYAHIPYIVACHLQIDAHPDPVPDPAYHFDPDPDADPCPDFFLCGSGCRSRLLK